MQYTIKSSSFKLKDIFECGQCFRWNAEIDGSYTGIFKDCVLNVAEDGNIIRFTGTNRSKNQKTFERLINNYFDLDSNYEEIKKKLSNVDDNLKKSIEHGKGIRILNQDLWETVISFIISANNNIPRIKGIIERLSKKYGEKIKWRDNNYYLFPTPKELSVASEEDLRKLGLGFRDKRVFETTKLIFEHEFELEKLYKMTTDEARNQLLLLPGVGPKVADCILLFSDLKRFDVFPVDVWVRRVMNDLYIHNENEARVNKNQIQQIANEKFGNLKGIAQQYLFYWKREA